MWSLVLRELIDTQWNVNVQQHAATQAGDVELIDTQWNVNEYEYVTARSWYRELIDTQWNVNKLDQAALVYDALN